MVSVAILCPVCGKAENVIKHGYNRSGTSRCRCLACKKTFTPAARSRKLPPEKQDAIERALAERISQQGIARMLKVSRNTVRAIRQKGHSE